jgi:outer membrane protein assembly factor BamB
MSDADVQARLRAYRDAVMRREVSPDAWPRLQRRLRREPWRRAGLAAAAVALVVAVAAAGPGLVASWTRREPTTAGKPGQPTVATQIPLGCTLSSAARNLEVGFGAVWVACQGALVRIDPASNRIAAVIPLQWMDANAGIAFSDDWVWVTSGSSAHPVVYQLDPARNREITQTPLPGGAHGIVIAEGTIWVTQQGSEPAKSGPGTVARLDADTGRRLRPIELPSPPIAIRSGLGAIWVTTYSMRDEFAAYRIDPRTGTVTRVPRVQIVVAAGPNSLWVTTDKPRAGVHRVDPATGRVLATVPDERVGRVAFGFGALWASTDTKLYRLDPNSAQPVGAPVALQDASTALAVGEGSIWVGEQGRESAIVRLNLTR